jgi:hypothetical protein
MQRLLWRLRRFFYWILDSIRRPTMTDDQQWEKWREDIDRIYRETIYVFENRYVFREVRELFRKNSRLNKEGGFVFEWLMAMYGRDMVLAVGRELDRGVEVVNLIQLMYQLTKQPGVITRKRFFAMLNLKQEGTGWPEEQLYKHLLAQNEKWFTDHVGAGDHLDPAVIKKDRNTLEKKCRKVMKYRHKVVAHRSTMKLTLTVADLDEALDAIEEMLKKYYLLFYGGALVGAEPTIQFDWDVVFNYPWAVPPAR